MTALDHYLRKFERLKRATYQGQKTPHKPILLLAVIDSIDAGEILSNQLFITPELVARFRDLWQKLVPDPSFKPNFAVPFYHLKSEGFWQLVPLPGAALILSRTVSLRSFSLLRAYIEYAFLNEDLWTLLQEAGNRELFRQALLHTYFNAAPPSLTPQPYGLYAELEQEMLHEPGLRYRQHTANISTEEFFVRNGIFKRVVPRVYNYTCCISGMQVTAANGTQMVDACHIVPFAESHDDTIGNGISLCPNLHRAYDRGLISITPDYKVRVARIFRERTDAAYGIRLFEGQTILLPKQQEYRPQPENLEQHFRKWQDNF